MHLNDVNVDKELKVNDSLELKREHAQLVIKETTSINLGDNNDVNLVKIGTKINPTRKRKIYPIIKRICQYGYMIL